MNVLSQNWPIESRDFFWSAGKIWAWRAASSIYACVSVQLAVSVLLVKVRAATEAKSLSVALPRLAMALTVSFM